MLKIAAVLNEAVLHRNIGVLPSFFSHYLVCLVFFQAGVDLLPRAYAQEGDVRRVHDPHIVKEAETYYIFSTGQGIPIRRSTDLYNWKIVGRVFDELPAWTKQEVPGSGSPWAPDILYFNGKYHLYYSISTFGSRRSCIGLVTNTTLDPQSNDYKWVDQGKVLESTLSDNFNAIDANPVTDDQQRLWLCFGSFWSGIKLRRLDIATGKTSDADAKLYALATRPQPGAIEAPFIYPKGEYYYLFASFDLCCKGVKSTYKIMVGRSKQITGPYLDRDGRPMLEGGGTLVLEGSGRYIGPGHNSVLKDGNKDWLVYHFYDSENRGIPTLQIRPLTWTEDGWPLAGEPLTNPASPSNAKTSTINSNVIMLSPIPCLLHRLVQWHTQTFI